jgi:hypothetical protein
MTQLMDIPEAGGVEIDRPSAPNQMMVDSMQNTPQDNNVSIYELDDDALIMRVKHLLAGEIFNPETGRWDKLVGVKPPMNDSGVHHFMIKFGGHLDKNIKLSDFTLEKIGEMMTDICNDILEIYWQRGREFAIDAENMTFIMHILEHQIYANYMRALDGKERLHRETVIRSVENIREVQSTATRENSHGFSFGNIFKKNNTGAGVR